MALGTDGDVSVAEFVGSLYGDLPLSEPSPPDGDDLSGAAAGAPPAEHTEPETEPAELEGDDPTEHAGAPPADAADSDPDDSTLTTDPLADAVAATYTVNGEVRTYEAIKVLGEHGALIDAKDLPDVMRRLGERDHLFEQSKQRYEEHEALKRLTAWETKDAQGNAKTLTGADALREVRLSNSRLVARDQILSSILDGTIDPSTVFGQHEDGRLFWRQDWVDGIREKMTDREEKYAWRTQRHFESLGTPQAQPQAAPSLEAIAEASAAPTIAQYEADYQIKGLTAEDRAFLAQQFPLYVNPDRQVRPAFLDLMKRTAGANTAKAQAVTQAADISKANAVKLAAAAQGRRSTHPARTPTAPARPAISPRAQDEADAWDLQENALHAGLLAHTRR